MQTLDIIAEHEDKFRVVALAAGSNVTRLADQVKRFKPQLVAIRNESLVDELKEALANVEEKPEIMTGEQGVIEAARHPDAATIVTGIVGCVGLKDSSVIGQLGWADMRIPLLYTMSWPERIYCSEVTWPRLDLAKLGSLTFMAPDTAKFPSVNLCYAAGRAGGTMTGVLSAANEKAVELFVNGKISYLDIFKVVELWS